jgi:hypothetical protein
LGEKLNAIMVPSFAACAVNGEGVMETLTMCCRLVLKKIKDKSRAKREVGVVKKEKLKESEKDKIDTAISELPDLKLVEKGEQLGEEEPLMDEVQEMGGQEEALKIKEEIALEVETPISEVNVIGEASVAAPSDFLVDEAVSQDTLGEEMKRTCPRCFLEFKPTVKKCPICKVSLLSEEEEAETGGLEVQPAVPKVTEEAAEEASEVAEGIAAVAGEAPEMAEEIPGVEEEIPEIPGIARIRGDEKGLEIVACGQPKKISSTAFKVPLIIRIEKSDQEFMLNLSINFEDFVLKSKD